MTFVAPPVLAIRPKVSTAGNVGSVLRLMSCWTAGDDVGGDHDRIDGRMGHCPVAAAALDTQVQFVGTRHVDTWPETDFAGFQRGVNVLAKEAGGRGGVLQRSVLDHQRCATR